MEGKLCQSARRVWLLKQPVFKMMLKLPSKTSLVVSHTLSGDGTMLLAASKVLDRLKPVIGVNTDPER